MLKESAKLIIEKLLNGKPFKFAFLRYLNGLDSQFTTLPIKNTHSDFSTLDSVEDALRVRAAYAIYLGVIQGIKKQKDTLGSKALYNEVFYQD